MDWLNGITEEMIEEIDTGSYDFEDYEAKSEVAQARVQMAYLQKHDSGAVSFNITFEKENRQLIFMQEFVKSGDEKGNKSTYTDKKTGEEKPLPGVIAVRHALKAMGEDFKSIGEPKSAQIEKGSNKVDVKVFDKLRGKMVIVANQAYEDDYSGDVQVRAKVVEVMDVDGKNYKGKEREKYWKERFAKEPVKKLKKKKVQKEELNSETKSALDSW